MLGEDSLGDALKKIGVSVLFVLALVIDGILFFANTGYQLIPLDPGVEIKRLSFRREFNCDYEGCNAKATRTTLTREALERLYRGGGCLRKCRGQNILLR